MTLTPMTANEVAVTDYLTQARDWLSRAVDETGPEEIAAKKAEIATAAEATKQLGLSKEIQLDAQEMVRRAEYALGKAIRKGQSEGTVGTRGRRSEELSQVEIKSPGDFGSSGEIYGNGRNPGVLDLADSVAELSDGVGEQTFDRAIEDAKAEGNLSRANVARKIIGKSGSNPEPPSASDDATLALLNDIRGPWTRGITNSARLMSPKARAHLIDALENALAQIRNIR